MDRFFMKVNGEMENSMGLIGKYQRVDGLIWLIGKMVSYTGNVLGIILMEK
jgi:hypothetical protein